MRMCMALWKWYSPVYAHHSLKVKLWLPGVVQMMLRSCHTYSEEGCDETWDLRKRNSDVNIVVIVFTPMMWESDTEYHSLPTCSDKCLFCLSSPSVPEKSIYTLVSNINSKKKWIISLDAALLLYYSWACTYLMLGG